MCTMRKYFSMQFLVRFWYFQSFVVIFRPQKIKSDGADKALDLHFWSEITLKFAMSCLFHNVLGMISLMTVKLWAVKAGVWPSIAFTGRTGRYLPFPPRPSCCYYANYIAICEPCKEIIFILWPDIWLWIFDRPLWWWGQGWGGVCLEIRFTLQRRYAKHGSQDHSRKACMQTNNEVLHRKLLKNLQSQSTIVVQQDTRQDWCGGFFTLCFPS